MDCKDESKRKISYDVHLGFRNYRNNSNSFCTDGRGGRDGRDGIGGDAIEIADEAIHERFPPEEGEAASEEDIRFHQALCEAGITTEALEELGGCEILPPLIPEIDEGTQDEEE
jgi:hypothetical protein